MAGTLMIDAAEKQRNRLLRRADWRFLLGNPQPEKSICFSGGLLAEAVAAVSAHVVPVKQCLPGECDLAVATNPNATLIQKSWQALHTGGSFYSEWVSPLAGGVAVIRKRLEAAGFTDVACYWPWPLPNYSPSLFWLPIEAPQAVRYFLSSRPRRASQLAQFGNNLLQIIWSFGQVTHLLVPICVVAQKVGLPLEADSARNLHQEIFEQRIDGEFKHHPHSPAMILWTGGKRSINKVVLFIFSSGEQSPNLVVKLPRTPESVPSLLHEAHILQALHSEKSEAAKHAPAIRFVNKFKNMLAVGESPVFGKPLYSVLKLQNAASLAMQVTDWLASMVSDGVQLARTAWWDRLVEPALLDFENNHRLVLDSSVMPKCRAILNRLGNLPSAFEHRDCSPWNLWIIPGNELAALDWESAEQDGLPAIDLTYFLTYLAFFMEGAMKNGKFIAAYRRATDPATVTGKIQQDCQRCYFESTHLDPANLHPLRLLTWLIHSRSEVRRLSADAGGLPTPQALHHSLFYNLVLEELVIEQAGIQ